MSYGDLSTIDFAKPAGQVPNTSCKSSCLAAYPGGRGWGRMLCMRFLLIILVAGCQISFGQDRDALAFAGCYELQADGQHTHISSYGVVPRRLQLTVECDSTSETFVG